MALHIASQGQAARRREAACCRGWSWSIGKREKGEEREEKRLVKREKGEEEAMPTTYADGTSATREGKGRREREAACYRGLVSHR